MSNRLTECFVGLRNSVKELVLFKSVEIENTMSNLTKKDIRRIKRLHEERNSMQRRLHSQNLEGSGSSKMSKGSKRRPQVVSDKDFKDAWDKIFVRKKTPKHGQSQVHRDKTKYNRKVSKTELLKDDTL